MNLADAIYELIGAVANLAVANGNVKLRSNDLAVILTVIDVESHEWDHYTSRTDDLIKKAYNYFLGKGDQATVDNIKNTFFKADGNPLIP